MKSILTLTLTLTTLLLATASALPSSPIPIPSPNTLSKRSTCATSAQKTTSDETNQTGPGIQLHNSDTSTRTFFVYENSCDQIPLKYTSIASGSSAFIALPSNFAGRVVRGTEAVNLDGAAHLLGTWLELTLGADVGGEEKAYADVSLIRGCDGAVAVAAADGTGASTGFDDDGILDDAPEDAYEMKDSGAKVLKATEDAVAAVVDVVRDYLAERLGFDQAYIDDYHGDPVICSSNGRFAAKFYKGRP
ncbi:hypothetical protein M426DRAFT_188734 [Hypoxylon sp. CI-4A]|nr:hypothetical protein M426DRAFT_188734 [Hypoxylon sp. CI-4A]